MTDLDKILQDATPPKPSADLQARILDAAQNTAQDGIPANDRRLFRWAAISAIAAACVAALVIWPSGTITDSDAVWQEAAIEAGFSDVLDWVNSEGQS